ncbi:hypothetical protein ACFE04_025274 [Oxalis oulophora]
MGESMVDSLNADKLAETTPSNPALQVSVSFGRFDNDALSWEKWSTFSPNKYLEEVEKCATPGSVAQKKAYFEAHYKKIAAKKAELLELEKQMDNGSSPLSSNELSAEDLIENNGGADTESDQEMNLGAELIESHSDETNEFGVVEQDIKDGELSANHVGEINEDGRITEECPSLSVEEVKEKMNGPIDIRKSIEAQITMKNEDVETPSHAPQELKMRKFEKEEENTQELKETCKFEKEEEKMVKIKVENLKSHRSKEPHKVTPASKEKSIVRTMKKPVSPMAKAQLSTPSATRTHFSTLSAPKTQFSGPKSQFSTPRVSKPAPTSLTMSMSRSSMVNGNSSSLLRSKNPSFGASKKVAPKSLHMSISLGHQNSDPPKSPAPSAMTARKSFIMEQMADKEIVKRAFKSFQNRYDQFKSSNEVPSKATQVRVDTSVTPRKENGGSLKAAVMDKKNAKSAPSFSVKNDDKTEKRREFSKKLDEKPNPILKEAGKTRLQTKSKEIIKHADIKQPRQPISSKATSVSSLHRGLKGSRNPSDKGISKN